MIFIYIYQNEACSIMGWKMSAWKRSLPSIHLIYLLFGYSTPVSIQHFIGFYPILLDGSPVRLVWVWSTGITTSFLDFMCYSLPGLNDSPVRSLRAWVTALEFSLHKPLLPSISCKFLSSYKTNRSSPNRSTSGTWEHNKHPTPAQDRGSRCHHSFTLAESRRFCCHLISSETNPSTDTIRSTNVFWQASETISESPKHVRAASGPETERLLSVTRGGGSG